MITKTKLKKVNTLEDLQGLDIGRVIYDLSHRGGYVGFYASAVEKHFKIFADFLPGKFGAYCNYLGGGIRGSITPSDFSSEVPEKKAILLRELAQACVRIYHNLEDESGMNDEENEDGEVNWEAKGSNAARNAGIVSAY